MENTKSNDHIGEELTLYLCYPNFIYIYIYIWEREWKEEAAMSFLNMSVYSIFDWFKSSKSCLTSGWNEFRKAPYFSQVLSTPTGTIFEWANNEMTNTIMSYIHSYKELEE